MARVLEKLRSKVLRDLRREVVQTINDRLDTQFEAFKNTLMQELKQYIDDQLALALLNDDEEEEPNNG